MQRRLLAIRLPDALLFASDAAKVFIVGYRGLGRGRATAGLRWAAFPTGKRFRASVTTSPVVVSDNSSTSSMARTRTGS